MAKMICHSTLPPHRVGVGAADPVVAPAQADLLESHAAVERDGRLVVGTDLQVDDAAVGELQQLRRAAAGRCPGPGMRGSTPMVCTSYSKGGLRPNREMPA